MTHGGQKLSPTGKTSKLNSKHLTFEAKTDSPEFLNLLPDSQHQRPESPQNLPQSFKIDSQKTKIDPQIQKKKNET